MHRPKAGAQGALGPLAALGLSVAALILSTAAGALLVAGLAASPAPAQEGTAPAQEGAAPAGAADAAKDKGEDAPVFFLRDSSKIAGRPKLDALEVQTSYGTLKVPLDQIVRIRFARRLSPEAREKIEKLVGDLGHDDFDVREAAMTALREAGPSALEALKKASRSQNEEVKNRAEILIGELGQAAGEAKPGADSLPPLSGPEDEVMTAKMTVKGVVPHSEFLIDSRYGELKVATADLAGVLFRSLGPTSGKFDVPASNQPPGNWLDTKLDLEKGQKLKIEATGQTHVRNYGVVAGPDGNREWGGTSFQNLPMLSLVGKIGKKGQAFLVGGNHSSKVRAAGRLYLAVVAFSPNPGGVTGSYQARVQASGGD
ncbi:MAG: hypothetical protein HY721_30070 [Planctomycetes bacterium]|nr:hypothetical protein [Planctomycetota bacterium]